MVNGELTLSERGNDVKCLVRTTQHDVHMTITQSPESDFITEVPSNMHAFSSRCDDSISIGCARDTSP